jgi:hypothetical protein
MRKTVQFNCFFLGIPQLVVHSVASVFRVNKLFTKGTEQGLSKSPNQGNKLLLGCSAVALPGPTFQGARGICPAYRKQSGDSIYSQMLSPFSDTATAGNVITTFV